MEDDKIKSMFQSFQPELSSDALFMSKLKRNMEAVRLVKRHTEVLKKRNRIAVCAASLSGFIVGVILTLMFPYIESSLDALDLALTADRVAGTDGSWRILGWYMAAAVSLFTALNVYEITVSGLRHAVRPHSSSV